MAKLRVRTKKWRPKAPFALLRCRFSLDSIAPPPYQAQQEESRGEQRQGGRLWDRVGARGRNGANRQRSQVYGLVVGRVGTDDRVESWPLEKTPRPCNVCSRPTPRPLISWLISPETGSGVSPVDIIVPWLVIYVTSACGSLMSADAEPARIVRHNAPENAAEQSEDRFFMGNRYPSFPV